jgi:hypothetical protein
MTDLIRHPGNQLLEFTWIALKASLRARLPVQAQDRLRRNDDTNKSIIIDIRLK